VHRRLWLLKALSVFVLALVAVPLPAQDDDHAWEVLRSVYDYKSLEPLNAVEGEVVDGDAWLTQTVSFDGADGQSVPGLLLLPKGVERPPCVLFMHGAGGSKENAAFVAAVMIPQGFAVFATDARLHGERAEEGRSLLSFEGLAGEDRPMINWVIDNRRALDYLEDRGDIDVDHVGLLGVSMGGIFGGVLAGVDDRINATALLVAGGRWQLVAEQSEHPAAAALRDLESASDAMEQITRIVDPVNFVGHIAPRPILMINGADDRIIPKACAEALHEAASEPKEIHWYEGGHVEIPPTMIATVVKWLVDNTLATDTAPLEAP